MFPFAIYEFANIMGGIKRYIMSFWNVNDMLLIIIYASYFTIAFAESEY